jgi:hypothetical protein
MTERRIASLAVAAMLLALLLAGGAPCAQASNATHASQVAKALDYLHARQHSDGGFAEKGSASSDSLTSWAIVAIAAADEDPNAWQVGGRSPVDYLSHQSAKWQQVTDVARTTLAVVAARSRWGRTPSTSART